MTLRNYIIIAALGSVLAVRAQEEPAAPVFRPPFDFPLILSGTGYSRRIWAGYFYYASQWIYFSIWTCVEICFCSGKSGGGISISA